MFIILNEETKTIVKGGTRLGDRSALEVTVWSPAKYNCFFALLHPYGKIGEGEEGNLKIIVSIDQTVTSVVQDSRKYDADDRGVTWTRKLPMLFCC